MTPYQIEQLTHRFRSHLDTIRARTTRAVTAAWGGLPDYEDHRVPQFAHRVTPVTRAAKVAAVAAGVGFYSIISTQRPLSVSATQIPVEYDPKAAFVAFWNGLGNGRPWEEAVQAGANRAASEADGLIVSSARLTGDHVLPRAQWGRVAAGNACTFCLEAANGTYNSAETADFGHERCACSVLPI